MKEDNDADIAAREDRPDNDIDVVIHFLLVFPQIVDERGEYLQTEHKGKNDCGHDGSTL